LTNDVPGNSGRQLPVPDPTLLTTQALLLAIGNLREYLESRIESLEDVQNEKHLQAEQQFELVERQRVEQKKDTKDAVDAALTAQKEAVREQTAASERAIAKSEAATSKQLDQLSVTFTAEAAAQRRELGEVKERVTAFEQQKVGAKETIVEKRDNLNGIYALIGAFGLIIIITISVIGLIATKP
jgi:hypothetical protein